MEITIGVCSGHLLQNGICLQSLFFYVDVDGFLSNVSHWIGDSFERIRLLCCSLDWVCLFVEVVIWRCSEDLHSYSWIDLKPGKGEFSDGFLGDRGHGIVYNSRLGFFVWFTSDMCGFQTPRIECSVKIAVMVWENDDGYYVSEKLFVWVIERFVVEVCGSSRLLLITKLFVNTVQSILIGTFVDQWYL